MRSSDAQGDRSTREEALLLGRDTETRVRDFLYAERWTWVSFLVHALGLLCVSLLPPQSSALALDMLNDDAHYARYLATPIERTVSDTLDFGGADAAPSTAKAADTEGQAGKADAPHKARRMSGGSQVQTSVDQRTSARAAGILGVLAAQRFQPNGPGNFNVQGAGDGALTALGAIFGASVGESFGFGGLGMHGTGRGGGGDAEGSVGVGKLGTIGGGAGGQGPCPGCVPTLKAPSHEARVPHLRGGVIEAHGSLSKEVIRRVIQRRLNEVRFCYEESLKGLPELEGRVEAKFVISPSGSVQAANVASNTLAGDGGRTARCIMEAVRRWSFPAPDGGGVVIVQYPFLLQAAQ